MTALTEDRNTSKRSPKELPFPVSAGVVCRAGGIAVLNGGYIEPGTTALSLVAQGRFEETVDNSGGADGDVTARVMRDDVFLFENSAAADEITQADVGANCYIVDDQTVAKTDGTGTRSVAGTIVGIESGKVWVQI